MKERKFLTLKMFCSFIVQQFRRLVCFHQNQSLLLPSDRVRNCPRDASQSVGDPGSDREPDLQREEAVSVARGLPPVGGLIIISPMRVMSSANFRSLTDWWLEVHLLVYHWLILTLNGHSDQLG